MKFRKRKGEKRSVRYVVPKLWSILSKKQKNKTKGGVSVGKKNTHRRIMKLPKQSVKNFRNLTDDVLYRQSYAEPSLGIRDLPTLHGDLRHRRRQNLHVAHFYDTLGNHLDRRGDGPAIDWDARRALLQARAEIVNRFNELPQAF